MKFKAWLKLARLQFYAFPALAVFAGAKLATETSGQKLELSVFVLTLLGVLLVEFITVITNEIHDLPTDRINQNAGAFTGGSKVLVNGSLTGGQVEKARLATFCLLFGIVIAIATLAPSQSKALSVVLGAGLLLGIGYTAPPLKLAYRGCGELTVALTHSVLVILTGFISQGGSWRDPVVWWVIWPLFFAILPSIILGGIPDSAADRAVGKRTIAVKFGPRWAAALASVSAFIAAMLYTTLGAPPPVPVMVAIISHFTLLEYRLIQLWKTPKEDKSDSIIILALGFMIWFVLRPII